MIHGILTGATILYVISVLFILTRVFVWEPLPIGSKSVLIGAHCVALHWIFVAIGWFRVYGFRRVYIGRNVVLLTSNDDSGDSVVTWREQYAAWYHPALWLSFLVHDLGYWGKPNMDGEEGEEHPIVGAEIVGRYFGLAWHDFVLFHSRFLAKQHDQSPSPLCMADKLATALTPRWLFLSMVSLTGEVNEYMAKSDEMNATGDTFKLDRSWEAKRRWHAAMVKYIRAWVAEHKDGKQDTWTPKRERAA